MVQYFCQYPYIIYMDKVVGLLRLLKKLDCIDK